nr:hypothetical protein [Tanacetum cinerariifolium]
MDVKTPTSVAPLPVYAPTLTHSTIATITTTQQAPTPSTTAPSTLLQDLPNFGLLFGFDHRLKTLEANFFGFMQTNQFVGAIFSILRIVHRYMAQRMNEAVKVSVQLQYDRLCDEAQKENDEFLKTIDKNMQKIIKEQAKEQVKVQVSKILPKIKQTVNEQLDAEVLSRSSNSSKTSYAVSANLLEMELKKILIKKIKGNKSIYRSNKQRNHYKALIEAYESDKIILDTYRDTVTLKRHRDDDADKDDEPSAGSDRGSKRRRERKDPESASAPKEKATRSAGNDLAKLSDSRSSFNELMGTPVDFSAFLMNRLKVDTLTPELLAGPTYELMKGSCKSHRVIPFDHFINNDLEYLRGGASSRKYTTSVTKTKVANYGHIKWIEVLMPRTMWTQEPVGYDKHTLSGTPIGGENVNSFTVLLSTGSLLAMSILSIESSLSLNSRLKADKSNSQRTICFQRLSLNVYKKHRNPKACGRPSTCDGTLTNVRTALDDRLKGIRMKYLPQTIWRKSDKERAAAMIQAIDKKLKTRRIMRSLESILLQGTTKMIQCWSADLKSKTTEDIISNRSFMEVLVLNHYVLVKKVLCKLIVLLPSLLSDLSLLYDHVGKEKRSSEIVLRAMGRAINKTITIVELIKVFHDAIPDEDGSAKEKDGI